MLKGKRSREVTGAQVNSIGGPAFVEIENKPALEQWQKMSLLPRNFAFEGGVAWPDSLKMNGIQLNDASHNIKPSELYSSEDAPGGFMLQLVAVSCSAASGTGRLSISITDGSNTVLLSGITTSTGSNYFIPAIPIYFTENTYVVLQETGSVATDVDYLCQVVSYAGNPQ